MAKHIKKEKTEKTEVLMAEEPVLDLATERANLAKMADKLALLVNPLSAQVGQCDAVVETIVANCVRLGEAAKTAEIATNYGFQASVLLGLLSEAHQALERVVEHAKTIS